MKDYAGETDSGEVIGERGVSRFPDLEKEKRKWEAVVDEVWECGPVGLQVERYAETVDASMSKAIAALVRLGLEAQEDRKREFFKRLKENLGNDDPRDQDRMVDEFRTLILGR